jgi:hypothetical protein
MSIAKLTLAAHGLEETFFCCFRKGPLAHAQQVFIEIFFISLNFNEVDVMNDFCLF